jgi:hypothetical protein
MKTMTLAAAGILALGVGRAASAESEGVVAAGALWRVRNGNGTVPASEWFAATRVKRLALSHQHPDQSPAHEYAAQTPSHSNGWGET